MRQPYSKFTLSVVMASFLILNGSWDLQAGDLEDLGEALYFDVNLSEPSGQSCASCHDPSFGFADPDSNLPVSEGVIPGLFGGRNSPSAAYAMYSPIRYLDETNGLWIGGQFWDSRATGEVLGDPLADQALGPFLNPVEMANTSKEQVVNAVAVSSYAELFEEVWGPDSLNYVEVAYDQIAWSIAAFERTASFAPFNSKYDAYLAACIDAGGDKDQCAQGKGQFGNKIGKQIFTKKERQGMKLFMGDAMCAACHVVEWTEAAADVVVPGYSPDGTVPPLFTDFTYDNLGVPKSTEYPISGANIDFGLGHVVGDTDEDGKFKVMTLRNIELTAPYAHNGLFKTLKEITHFYNTRDVPGALPNGESWPPPEYPATVNFNELGDLGLNDAQEDAIVEFMKTLTDGYTP